MGFADARGTEQRESIEKPNVSPKPPDEELKALTAAVKEWDGKRREHLSQLLKILEPTSDTGSADQWRNRADQFGSDLRTFGEALRSVSNASEWSKNWVQMNVKGDSAFASALVDAKIVAETRDSLIKRFAMVEEQKTNLEKKWENLLKDAKDFEKDQNAIIEDLQKLQEKAAYEAKSFLSKFAHEIADLPVKLNKELGVPGRVPKGMPIPGKTYVEIAALFIQTWRALRPGFDADVVRLQALFVQETGSTLFLFGKFRKDTAEFIQKFGYKASQEEYDRAKRALDDFVSRAGTSSGNKTDAQQFAEAAGIHLAGHLNRVKQSWDSFAEKHEKKFFGPVGPDIRKALLDRDTFHDKYEKLLANDLHSLLSKWRAEERSIINVPLEGFDDESKSYLREVLTNDLRELDAALQEEPSQKLEAIDAAEKNADKAIE